MVRFLFLFSSVDIAGPLSPHRYTKLVSRKIGHTVRSQKTADTLLATDAAHEFSHARARAANAPSAVLLCYRRLRAALRKYFGRRVELALCMLCDVFSSSSVHGSLQDLETLLLSLDADTLPLGEVDRALRRRGIGEWPRQLIFERLTVLGQAADQRQQLYAEAKAQTLAQQKTAQSHAEIAAIAAHLKERESRLKQIEIKLGIGSDDPLFELKHHPGLSVMVDAIKKDPSSLQPMLVLMEQREPALHKVVMANRVAVLALLSELTGRSLEAQGPAPAAGAAAAAAVAAPSALGAATAAPAPVAAATDVGTSRWTAHREIATGRAYYSDSAGVVRWEPPADLVSCPFDGGTSMWVYISPKTGRECDAPVSLAALWSMAAAGDVRDDVRVGVHGTPHFWPLKSIMRRAMTVAHLFESCGAAEAGDAIAVETLTGWLAEKGAVEGAAINLLALFQSVDTDEDGAVSRAEFMRFLLQHASSVQSLVEWIDSKW